MLLHVSRMRFLCMIIVATAYCSLSRPMYCLRPLHALTLSLILMRSIINRNERLLRVSAFTTVAANGFV